MGDHPPSGDDAAGAHPTTDRWRLALEAGGIGVWEWDLRTDDVWWSPRSYEIARIDPGGFAETLESFIELVHPDDRATVRAGLETARHGQGAEQLELRLAPPGGPVTWAESRAMVVTDSDGIPRSMVGTLLDITERKETERAREHVFREELRARSEAEAARERLQFLTSAGREIRAVLDPVVVRRTAVELVAQHLAEWALILDRSGTMVEAGAGGGFPTATHTPGGLGLVEPHAAVSQVVATGDPQLASIPMTLALGADGETTPLVLEASSIVVVPLVFGASSVGIMVAGHGRTGRPYQAEDLDLFSQYAESVAATLVKATLFEDRSAIARTLQRSLLPASLPQIDGIEIGSDYQPVGDGLIVGGDFYDVFQISDGRFAFAIGDVSGKGSEAAAVTAQVRHSIRAYAEVHEDPAEVLRAVNDAIRVHGPPLRYCTVAFGVLTTGDDVEVRVAVGGHPLPLVVRADASIEPAGSPGTLIGMFADVRIRASTVRLAPGDTLVLYTDGVVEARRGGVPFGDERLKALVKSMTHESPRTIAAAVGAAVAEYRDDPSDDLAVLLIRRSGT